MCTCMPKLVVECVKVLHGERGEGGRWEKPKALRRENQKVLRRENQKVFRVEKPKVLRREKPKNSSKRNQKVLRRTSEIKWKSESSLNGKKFFPWDRENQGFEHILKYLKFKPNPLLF